MGMTMKIGGTNLLQLFWNFEYESQYLKVFGSYRYHANAATFLIINLAFVIGLAMYANAHDKKGLKAFATTAVYVILFAIFFNTSRAGWFLTVILAFLYLPRICRNLQKSEAWFISRRKIIVGTVIATVAIIATMLAIFGADEVNRAGRLSNLTEKLGNRFPLYLFLKMVPDTPMFGFGPGTFSFVFPKYQLGNPGTFQADRYLNEAHNDYFQIFFDWGVVGFLSWATLLILPLCSYIRWGAAADTLGFACFIAALSVLIHATMDFPLQITSLLFYFGIALAILINPTREYRSQTLLT